MQRKDEILAKRAKLAELRRQREEREQRLKASTQQAQATEDSEVTCPYPFLRIVSKLTQDHLGSSTQPSTLNGP